MQACGPSASRPAQVRKEARPVHAYLQVHTNGLALTAERHYRLVPPDEMTIADLDNYRRRPL